MLHSKIEEIIKFSLKSESEEMTEELTYTLIKYILDLTAPAKSLLHFPTTNTTTHGYHAHILSLANELVKISKDSTDVKNILDSIPEWTNFHTTILDQSNKKLEGDLGGRDPRVKDETPFDDGDFLGRFKGFKPVPFESIKQRRKNLGRQDEDIEEETEEEEEEDEEKLDFDEINRYFTSNDQDEIDIELDMEKEDIFSRQSEDSRDLKPSNIMKGRYDTIELEEDDDEPNRGLEWDLDPVGKEADDEKIIDDTIKDVAMEFIEGQKSRRKHKKNKECFMEMGNKDFLFKNNTLKEIQTAPSHGLPELEDSDHSEEEQEQEEKKEYYDTNYWADPYQNNFKIEDLLLE